MSTQPTQLFLPKRVLLGLLGAGFLLECLTLPHYLKVKNSAAWPHTQGVITTSRLEGSYRMKKEFFVDHQPIDYYAVIAYDYSVGGIRLHSTRISFNKVHMATQDAWQPVVDSYPVGKKVEVYYDPKEPSFAVIEPGLFGEMHILYVMCFVMLSFFGGVFLFFLFLQAK